MKLSTIRNIKNFCQSLHSDPCWREVVNNIIDGASDFEVDNVRFIDSGTIDNVLVDELESDTYILGCFRASFISCVTGWPEVLISALQEAEGFEGLGKAIIEYGFVEKIAEEYIQCDGYGHHFNSYDGSEDELRVNNVFYHVFDNR